MFEMEIFMFEMIFFKMKVETHKRLNQTCDLLICLCIKIYDNKWYKNTLQSEVFYLIFGKKNKKSSPFLKRIFCFLI